MTAFSALAAGVLAMATLAHAGIYPDGHWERSTELTPDNVDDFVQENVDKGKTAPSWNKVCEDFAGNPDVAFGDVSLSKSQVRKIHGVDQNPGAGGWPTVRYFNKATGYGGKAYEKKTNKAMCDELGPKEDYMRQYVEEAGGTSLCNINASDKGCNKKQQDFIEKYRSKTGDELKKQQERLQGMLDKGSENMQPDALSWAKQRLSIIKQFMKASGAGGEEL